MRCLQANGYESGLTNIDAGLRFAIYYLKTLGLLLLLVNGFAGLWVNGFGRLRVNSLGFRSSLGLPSPHTVILIKHSGNLFVNI